MEFIDNIFVNLAAWLRGLMSGIGLNQSLVEAGMALIYIVALLAFITLTVLFLVWMERKVSGYIQLRPGPNRLGPHGIFQTIADAIKLLTKEDIVPRATDKWVHFIAPVVVFLPTILAFAVIPFGDGMIAADINIGIFYFIAVASLATIPLIMAGWGSNNKYSLLGGMRAVAQMVSYEIPLVFSILGVVMIAGSLKMSEIVTAQSNVWFIFLQPVGFLIYAIAATSEVNRTPFDIPEGESEIIAGYHTEYSGMKFALFFLAEYTNLFLVSALATTLFLGGWQGPFLPPWIWFMLKTLLMVFLFMWIRFTFPRVRIDQLMNFGWKFLLPLSLANILVTGIAIFVFNGIGW